ncbi:LysR family transcriptional regulator [Amycolatopsis australiensis]|uniref:DNA-binding transcriptional regulator, LysR family n=1 Tax=Amycolatopsis australiensis TaxID=546364 RepID=A0A1K1T429_9PSEU|nr:LysR family transcriptional regulator [Amycolatopsis australiensis]SFW91328.1 DNA-binding transcriptional regulator, LysR family [Amycolatopsis australiensis]
MNDLEAFVAVAEELHFGRAADRLGRTQPSLSRAVAGLERELGVTLFDRSTRSVALTRAGAAMLPDARAAVEAAKAARRRAQRNGALVVVSKPDGDAGLLPGILAALGEPADLLFAATGDEAARMLRDGRGDVALIPAPFDRTGLDVEPVTTEPRVAAQPRGREAATLREVLARPAVTWPGVDDRLDAYYRARDPRTVLADPPPARLGPPAKDLAEALRLVELGQAVTFLPRSVARRYPREGIAYREIDGLSDVRLQVAWPSTSRSPRVAAFVRTALRQ